ncbi:cytochrome oxidase assembly factor [Salix suchowensis]|nr:cytochrome oxidase assembly factor [Salix suchowensis]
MSKSCKGLALELVKCLSESNCIKKSPAIPSECVGLRETYFNCKRGQVDMRARIRGNKGY